jgi:hypothetical protein
MKKKIKKRDIAKMLGNLNDKFLILRYPLHDKFLSEFRDMEACIFVRSIKLLNTEPNICMITFESVSGDFERYINVEGSRYNSKDSDMFLYGTISFDHIARAIKHLGDAAYPEYKLLNSNKKRK